MPTNKNAIPRYYYLDELLSDVHHYYDIHDLTERVNRHLVDDGLEAVGERCIQKDLKDLEYTPFWVELDRSTIDGKHVIRYADPCYTIFSKKLTEDEKNLLSEVLSTLGQFDGLDNFEWLEKLRNRLGIKERPRIISFSSNPDLKGRDLLGRLFSAIAAKVPIKIQYRKFDAVRESPAIIVHPYLLKQHNNRWFLFCGADKDDFLITYSLDRIVSFEPLPTHPFKECTTDLEERFDNIVGVTLPRDPKTGKTPDPEDVLLWVSDEELPYITTKPIYPYQHLVPKEMDGKYRTLYPALTSGRFIEMNIIPNRELLQAIAAYFDGVEILQPASLRKQFADYVNEMYKRYK